MTFVEQYTGTVPEQALGFEWAIDNAAQDRAQQLQPAHAERTSRVISGAFHELRDDMLPVATHVGGLAVQAQALVLPTPVHAVNGTKIAMLDDLGLRHWSLTSSGGVNYPSQQEFTIPPRASLEKTLETQPLLGIIRREYAFRRWATQEHPEASEAAKYAQHVLMQSPSRSMLLGGLRGVTLIARDMQLQGYTASEVTDALDELSFYHEQSLNEAESESHETIMRGFVQLPRDPKVLMSRHVPGTRRQPHLQGQPDA